MRPGTEQAYRAWRSAAEKGYGKRPQDTPGHMHKVDERIRRLKARYEALLAQEKPMAGRVMLNPYVYGRGALSPIDRHQIKVARQTLLMPDAMVGVMGGTSKEEAREILERFRAKGYGRKPRSRNPRGSSEDTIERQIKIAALLLEGAVARGDDKSANAYRDQLDRLGRSRQSAKRFRKSNNPWGAHDVHSFHTGPSQVGQFAKRFREAGIPVDVEGVEKVWVRSPRKREELLEQYRRHHGRTHGLRNPGWLYPESGAGSKTVSFIDRFGQRRKGKIVMKSSQPGYWVLNMGGKHGTPAVVHESEIISTGGPSVRKNSSRRRGRRSYRRVRRNSPLTVYVGRKRHSRRALIKKYGPKRAAKYWRRAKTKYHGYGKLSARCTTRRSRR